MNHLFALYTTITLVTGLALLLVWRRDPEQAFARHLGLAHVLLAANPLAYLLATQPDPLLKGLGLGALIVVGAWYFELLCRGFLHLSQQEPGKRRLRAFGLWLAVALVVTLQWGIQAAQGLQAVGTTALGLLSAWWLRKGSAGERWCGLLLVFTGLNQFLFALQGEAGLPTQLVIATLLRVLLVLALVQAALDRSASEARRLRDRFTQLTERSHQGVVVLHKGQAVYTNPAFRRIYGVTEATAPADHSALPWLDATVPRSEHQVVNERARRILKGEIDSADWEGDRYALDGHLLRLRFSAWRIDWDGQKAIQMVITDETERHRVAQELRHQAVHDELTGLPNRAGLLQRLRETCALPISEARVLVVLDVDRFKLFNEAHGHAVGDEVLSALSRELRKTFQGQAEVMRLGEDEFAVLSLRLPPGPSLHDQATQLTGQIKALLARPIELTQFRFFLDVSMGVALYPNSGDTPEALLQAAHAAMHEAKRVPGTSVQFAEASIQHHLAALLTTEQSLRNGLENQEFNLLYQPKVHAVTHGLVGFEALVRWDRPGLGRMNPVDFIPAAERTGLIVPLGALILAQACRQMALWRAEGREVVPVAVNVSPLQLLDVGFPSAVMGTLALYDIPPQWLTLEITESVAVTHMEQACEQIAALRAQGVEMALDDFGTGFSSLNMLRSLPLRTVKIDRSLIDPMPVPEATAVVRAICDLATTLRLDVVAEGVETLAHAQAALAAGCHVLQGFWHAHPLEVGEASDWLDARVSARVSALASAAVPPVRAFPRS